MSSCLGHGDPCENISLGSCNVSEDIIVSTFTADPEKCSKLCEIEHSCVFWRARWDGTLCYLLSKDYQYVSIYCIFVTMIIGFKLLPN